MMLCDVPSQLHIVFPPLTGCGGMVSELKVIENIGFSKLKPQL
jgi:hypothetical protein